LRVWAGAGGNDPADINRCIPLAVRWRVKREIGNNYLWLCK